MNSTFHKWGLNAMTAPNPTQYTKGDEYKVEKQNRDCSEICPTYELFVFAICCYQDILWLQQRQLEQRVK